MATRKGASAAFAARGWKTDQNCGRCDKARKDTNHCEFVTLDGVADGDDVTLTGTVEVGSAEVVLLPSEVVGAPGVASTGRTV